MSRDQSREKSARFIASFRLELYRLGAIWSMLPDLRKRQKSKLDCLTNGLEKTSLKLNHFIFICKKVLLMNVGVTFCRNKTFRTLLDFCRFLKPWIRKKL